MALWVRAQLGQDGRQAAFLALVKSETRTEPTRLPSLVLIGTPTLLILVVSPSTWPPLMFWVSRLLSGRISPLLL